MHLPGRKTSIEKFQIPNELKTQNSKLKTLIVMDGFSYVNIFDTKGIEYIVIIIFLLLLIPFWIILNKKKEIATELRKAIKYLSAKISNSPPGLYYSQNHTWAFLEKSGAATIGLDDVLLHLTGNIEINYLKDKGEEVRKGDLIAEIDQKGRKLRIFSPISGKILKLNPLVEEIPEIINEDPYDKGWLFSIKPSAWKVETQSCYLAEEAKDWLNGEMVRVRDFVSVNAPKYSPDLAHITLQDGGELSENLLADMPPELWQDFQKEFLDPK
jgi:glycine cleavage system H protein